MLETRNENNAAEIPLETISRKSDESTKSSELNHLLSDEDLEESHATSSFPSPTETNPRLPAQDTSLQAWTCLLGCWLLEAMGWGLPISFGLFQHTYASLAPFSDPASAPWIPTIGTLATGLAFLPVPLINALILRLPHRLWTLCFAGWVITLLGLVGASFAQSVWGLMVWQGGVYGLGWLACYTPFLFMLNGWFVKRRGLVYGLLFGASGVSGLVIPNGLGAVVERYGFRVALRAYAVATVLVGGPGLLLIRTREGTFARKGERERRDSQQTDSSTRILRDLLWNKHFWLMVTVILIQGLGFFIPNIFIPSFASDLGLSQPASSSLLAIISLAQFLGQVWQGWISDRINIYIPVSISALIPGLAALLLWGPAKGMAMLVPFAFIWGFFSASYTVLYTRMCTFLAEDGEGHVDEEVTILLYGLFSFERGLANILEGPISRVLMAGGGDLRVDRDAFALGKYKSLVWFTVGSMLISSLAGVGWFWGRYEKGKKDRG